jgi:hypothetical protein
MCDAPFFSSSILATLIMPAAKDSTTSSVKNYVTIPMKTSDFLVCAEPG